jgi:uncharacterized membrane protein YfcA|tara:strand:- start:3076 stop:3843 length:768 start_codon:yes stop_codon:yes gene_type:complete
MFDFVYQIPWEYPLLIVVGLIVGFINTMAGGGSLLTLPILIFLGLPSSVANGTNRIAIMMTAFSANMGFKSKGISTFPFSAYTGSCALVGSIIGAHIAIDLNDEAFNKILSIIMIIVILIIVFKPKIISDKLSVRLTGKHLRISCIVFFFVGVYGGFVNAGIGFVIMLFLHFYNRMNLVRVNATKVVIVLVYTLGAFLTFVFNDLVDYSYGFCLAIGTIIGGWNASRFAVKKGEKVIKIFLVISVFIISFKLWFF